MPTHGLEDEQQEAAHKNSLNPLHHPPHHPIAPQHFVDGTPDVPDNMVVHVKDFVEQAPTTPLARTNSFGQIVRKEEPLSRTTQSGPPPPSLWADFPAADYVTILTDDGKQFHPTVRQRVLHSESETVYALCPLRDTKLQITEHCILRTPGVLEFGVHFRAVETVRFSFNREVRVEGQHDKFSECDFLLPGLWYKHNLVAGMSDETQNIVLCPNPATNEMLSSFAYNLYPSVRVGTCWTVREDKVAYPVAAVYHRKSGEFTFIQRMDVLEKDSLLPGFPRGEVVLEGDTDIGSLGFKNNNGSPSLVLNFPWYERDFAYQRKGTILPLEEQGPVQSFLELKAGESKTVSWRLVYGRCDSYHELVCTTWEASYAHLQPKLVPTSLLDDEILDLLCHYFVDSYLSTPTLHGFKCVNMSPRTCEVVEEDVAFEVGFVGRVLMNATNCYTYGQKKGRQDLIEIGTSVLTSWFEHGFTENGLLKEIFHANEQQQVELFTSRRQGEAALALIQYLEFERHSCRPPPAEYESKVKRLLETCISLQQVDGSFPRAFDKNLAIKDANGGGTSCMVPALIHAFRYFDDPKYRDIAIHAGYYIVSEVVEQDNYTSSTIDANCPDKEAATYAATAMWYLAGVTEVEQLRQRLTKVAAKACDFALSYFMLYDTPFAAGHILKDQVPPHGLHTRGWGLVSSENNHIDCYAFDFLDVLRWVGDEVRPASQGWKYHTMANLIASSLREQLLPRPGRMCGIGKVGYMPEVVQQTLWDYGKNGKGTYNYFMAFGWPVASIWRMLERRVFGFHPDLLPADHPHAPPLART